MRAVARRQHLGCSGCVCRQQRQRRRSTRMPLRPRPREGAAAALWPPGLRDGNQALGIASLRGQRSRPELEASVPRGGPGRWARASPQCLPSPPLRRWWCSCQRRGSARHQAASLEPSSSWALLLAPAHGHLRRRLV